MATDRNDSEDKGNINCKQLKFNNFNCPWEN